MRGWIIFGTLHTVLLALVASRIFQNAKNPSSFTDEGSCGLRPHETYVVVSRNVVFPGGVRPAALLIKEGRVADIALLDDDGSNLTLAAYSKFSSHQIDDYGDLIVSPGLIDTHVHLNEPGREHWEGFVTGTKAAAAGGTTTVIVMPLNSLPAIVEGELLRKKVAVSEDKLWVDAGFWGGLVSTNAANHTILKGLLDAGALGFKSFMSPSGIVDFCSVDRGHIAAALPFLKAEGVPYYVHAELPDDKKFEGDVRSHVSWENSRPPYWEENAISLLMELLDKDTTAASPGFRLHIAHLSSTTALPIIAKAKQQGVPLSVETGPHYLNFVSHEVPEGDTRFKCAPPLRGAENRDALWQGLADSLIDSVASDHSPAPPDMKSFEDGDFNAAWGGIAGLQYNLPATWHGMSTRGLGPEMLAKWFSEAPAKLAGLGDRKGSIALGYDADFVVWDPEKLADTSEASLLHKHKLTPFTDVPLKGRVAATYVRGQLVFKEGSGVSPRGCGTPLLRGQL